MKIGRLARTGVPGLWALYCPVNLGVTYSYTLQTPLPGSPIGLDIVDTYGTVHGSRKAAGPTPTAMKSGRTLSVCGPLAQCENQCILEVQTLHVEARNENPASREHILRKVI